MRYGSALIWRGVFAVLFGVTALLWSGITIEMLVLWFGAFSLISGIWTTVSAVRAASHHTQWGLLLMSGLLSVAVGVLALVSPGQMAVALVWVLGVWALITGIFEIAAALTSPWAVSNKGLLGMAGLFSVVFGVLLIANPIAGALSLVWLMGAYAILVGGMLVVLGVQLRKT